MKSKPEIKRVINGALNLVAQYSNMPSCNAITERAAINGFTKTERDALARQYREFSGALSFDIGFDGVPNFGLLSVREKQEIRFAKLSEFLNSLED